MLSKLNHSLRSFFCVAMFTCFALYSGTCLAQETVNPLSFEGNKLFKELVYEECDRQEIQVSEFDISSKLESNAGKFGMSKQRYVNLICSKREFSIAELNEIVRFEIAVRKLIRFRQAEH